MRRTLSTVPSSNIASSNIHTIPTLVIINLLMMVSACSQKTVKASQTQITVSLESPACISGKGAGAGMMLSGSMGAMGVAIAIDKGIAKDIEVAAQTVDFSMAALVGDVFRGVFRGVFSGTAADRLGGRFSSTHIVVERYDFNDQSMGSESLILHAKEM
ncbi:MAG: hypothetical protein ACI93R_002955 [Flavobacteriales bacterium]|jgi:hypothetical protein